ncbi:hypothetical protein TNCV_3821061 [Trichonephila clavipes]|nr:hypothetical protein TNCV_3821061 [Trichonephila clavipes]
MLPVDERHFEHVREEPLKLKKKETSDWQQWNNVTRREERRKRKNKEVTDWQPWHNVTRKEERIKRKNKEVTDWQPWHSVTRREERAEETHTGEQRSHRLSTMAQHARRRSVNVTEEKKCLQIQTF